MKVELHQFGPIMFKLPWSDNLLEYDKDEKAVKLRFGNSTTDAKVTLAELYDYMKDLTRQEDEHTL